MDTERFTCINNQGYEVSLEMSATYNAIHDVEAPKHQMVHIIDETGEDYLYLKSRFIPATTFAALSEQAREEILSAANAHTPAEREFRARA